MNALDFKQWLRTEYVQQNGKLLAEGTQVSRVANCSTVEQIEGDLDVHFVRDGMQEILKRLTYTAEDQRLGKPALHRIPIDGDIVNGTSTYRAAVNLYRKFLVAQQCVAPASEPEDSHVAEEIEKIDRAPISRTEKEAIVKSRIGQGVFRFLVLELWDYRCAVTGAGILLCASHIKPWRVSSNAERLDGYNGLALSPVFDKAFDAGLITFEESGEIVLSPRLSETDAEILGLRRGLRIHGVTQHHRPFLDYHRGVVWKH